jgi:hypothetical protein
MTPCELSCWKPGAKSHTVETPTRQKPLARVTIMSVSVAITRASFAEKTTHICFLRRGAVSAKAAEERARLLCADRRGCKRAQEKPGCDESMTETQTAAHHRVPLVAVRGDRAFTIWP